MAVFPSGDNRTDALLLGESWTGNTGQPSPVIEYTIIARNDAGEITNSALDIDPIFKSAVDQALASWVEVADVRFNYRTPSVIDPTYNTSQMITFDYTNAGGALGYSANRSSADGAITGRDIVIDNNSFTPDDFGEGGYGFLVLIHEIGHALGLAHPDSLTGAGESPLTTYRLPDSEANLDGSTMISLVPRVGDFTDYTHLPSTPQVWDIAAIQYLYGAKATNVGDTGYSFDGTNQTKTLWDAGGNDWIDQTFWTGNLTLDIRETNDAMVIGDSRIWFAQGSNIESIYSGSGNDLLYGNGLANVIMGNAGNDSIDGSGGADTLDGGAGVDTLNMVGTLSGTAADLLSPDQLTGSSAVAYGFEHVNATLATSAMTLLGNDASNLLAGGIGGDNILGRGGDDFILGGFQGYFDLDALGGYKDSLLSTLLAAAGVTDEADYDYANLVFARDIINGNAGNDTIYSGHGNDSVHGGQGNDIINGNAGNDIVNGDAGDDVLYGGQGSDNISGGDGNDTLQGNLGGLDELTGNGGADNFWFPLNSAADTIIWDFDTSENDVITLSSLDTYISEGEIINAISVTDPDDTALAGTAEAQGWSEITLTNGIIRVIGSVVEVTTDDGGTPGDPSDDTTEWRTTLVGADFDII